MHLPCEHSMEWSKSPREGEGSKVVAGAFASSDEVGGASVTTLSCFLFDTLLMVPRWCAGLLLQRLRQLACSCPRRKQWMLPVDLASTYSSR